MDASSFPIRPPRPYAESVARGTAKTDEFFAHEAAAPERPHDMPKIDGPSVSPSVPMRVEVAVLRVVAAVIALCANGMSIYYSYAWFAESLPVILALVMALIMVAVISLAPQFTIILLARKGFQARVAAVILATVAIPSALFSMGSTVAGFYNKRSRTVAAVESARLAADTTTLARKQVQAKIERLEAEVERARKEEALYWERYTSLSNAALGSRAETLLGTRMDSAGSKTLEAEKALNDAIAELAAIPVKQDERLVRDDFYTWVSARIGWPVERTELILAAFPAVFIDIIAPAMLAVALFL